MYKAVTKDVEVSVEAFYQETASNPEAGKYVFAYRISIENHSEFTIKLLRRHWHIIDSSEQMSEIEGEGVIGQQPVIEPEQKHEYVSGCELQSEMGKMYGTYLMEKQIDGSKFEVEIPEFVLVVPYRLN